MLAAVIVTSFPGSSPTEIAKPCPSGTRAAGKGCVTRSAAFVRHGERCRSARRAAVYYRALTWERQDARGGERAERTPIVRGKTCRWSRYAASEWQARARSARRALERWERERTLRDFVVRPGNNAWYRAVEEVQVVFPSTSSWLLSCSSAEGGHGRWVRYGGGSYYQGYEHTDQVGNWMQFRWSTFRGMLRHALKEVHHQGFRVPAHVRDPNDVRAWLSPLGAALAAGWARWAGKDDSHWSASWSNGCR